MLAGFDRTEYQWKHRVRCLGLGESFIGRTFLKVWTKKMRTHKFRWFSIADLNRYWLRGQNLSGLWCIAYVTNRHECKQHTSDCVNSTNLTRRHRSNPPTNLRMRLIMCIVGYRFSRAYKSLRWIPRKAKNAICTIQVHGVAFKWAHLWLKRAHLRPPCWTI